MLQLSIFLPTGVYFQGKNAGLRIKNEYIGLYWFKISQFKFISAVLKEHEVRKHRDESGTF